MSLSNDGDVQDDAASAKPLTPRMISVMRAIADGGCAKDGYLVHMFLTQRNASAYRALYRRGLVLHPHTEPKQPAVLTDEGTRRLATLNDGPQSATTSTQSTAATREQEAITALSGSRERLLAMVRRVHISPDCLPVPKIQVPTDRAEFEVKSRAISRNLFTEEDRRAPHWVTARQNCPHLPPDTVRAINDVIYRWYQLLHTAARHIDGNRNNPYDLAWSVQRLDAAIDTVPAAPERDVIIQDTTVARLHLGDEFSLDSGQNWHVLVVDVSPSGQVGVYTGEHDHHGDALIARMPAEANQPCLLRRTRPAPAGY